MSKTKTYNTNAATEPETETAPGTFNDEYTGKGGSYIVNPETGKREPAPPQD